MRELTPLVEPVSIDEAFLDLSGTERVHHASPAAALVRFARRVEDEIGITVSVGLSYNKFLAKIASDLEKPRGFSIIGRREAGTFLGECPIGIVPGVGAAAQARLAKIGVTLVRHLREARAGDLARILGRDASRLAGLARGEDPRPVRPERETKSLSAETTFETDLRAFEALRPILWRLTERVSGRLKRSGLAARSVTLKLKDFVPAADPHPLRPAGDAAGRPPVRSGRTHAARSMRRRRLPADRHRRIGPVRCGGSRPWRPRGPEGAPRGRARGRHRPASRKVRAGGGAEGPRVPPASTLTGSLN